MTKETGGPAFPSMRDMRHNPDFDHEEGMTLRDYFAAKALHYCLKNCFTGEGAVKDAYEVADAMLKAREQ
jgi:hypothetical protein